MTSTPTTHASLDDWIRLDAISFDADSQEALNTAVDQVVASLGDEVQLLGFGEAFHGGEDVLILRNRLFQRLVEAHGFSAIAVESSFPRARLVDEFVAGRGPASYKGVRDDGFSNRFGHLETNRELAEWMRAYNADRAHDIKLRFYGVDMPLVELGYASPRQVLHFALDYLTAIDRARGKERRQRIDPLLGEDAAWENTAVFTDPSQSIGLSHQATALRIETENLLTELRIRRPELIAGSDAERYAGALHYVTMARALLNYHAETAARADASTLLGIRDAAMADNVAYIAARERGRGAGKVLVFAHNSHLQRSKAVWPWYAFWPLGSHLNAIFGSRYAVIGSAVGSSQANGIGQPDDGTLEARLSALPGSATFIPTHKGAGLPAAELAALRVRSGSQKNQGYGALTAQSLTDFDWLAFLDSTGYVRGWPPLPDADDGAG
ncbi:MAG: erythromycin esterase family protein [Anaerolineae bacterium]|nr:erythromycin esterase family protein [Anaerolineae bacterium]